jgi:hypothetical protein
LTFACLLIPYFVPTPSYRPVSNKALYAEKDISLICEHLASLWAEFGRLRVATLDF